MDPADPVTGKLSRGGFEANPCSLAAAPQFDTIPQQQPNMPAPACTGVPQVLGTPAMRPAQAIKFRNRAMTLTLVDPYQSCIPDKQPDMPPAVPPAIPYGTSSALVQLANRGYQIEFEQTGGFSPFKLPGITPSYPVKVVSGPSESIWVIDDGDVLSTGIGQSSTRGQVFRVESVDLGINNVLQ